jgi:hypothetical protein
MLEGYSSGHLLLFTCTVASHFSSKVDLREGSQCGVQDLAASSPAGKETIG